MQYQGYVEIGFCDEALNFVEHLQMEGFIPIVVTYLSRSRVCSKMGNWDEGQELHLEIAKDGYERHLFLAYACTGCIRGSTKSRCDILEYPY